MKAIREDFENILQEVKKMIADKHSTGMRIVDFKDYTDYETELKEFLSNNSSENWVIKINFTGIAVEKTKRNI